MKFFMDNHHLYEIKCKFSLKEKNQKQIIVDKWMIRSRTARCCSTDYQGPEEL